jgi:hypothetical protein
VVPRPSTLPHRRPRLTLGAPAETSPAPGRPWGAWAIAAVLVVLTIAVRAPGAVSEALWSDEVATGRVITAPTEHLAVKRIRRESSPPASFYVGRITHKAGVALERAVGVGKRLTTMGTLRLWSVLFSAALTLLTFLYARRLLPLWSAALAGLLTALGYQFVVHGKELRAYAMLALLSLALPMVLEWTLARPNLRRLAALAAVVALGSLTHYFFLLVGLGCLVWLWLVERPPAKLRATVAMAAGLVPLAAWLPITLFQAGRINRYFPAFDGDQVVDLYSNLFASGAVWSRVGDGWRLAVLAAVLAGAALLARRAEGRLAAILVVLPVAVTALVWALGLNIFTIRNLIVAAPFAAIAVAAVPAAIPVRPLAVGATAVVAGLALWTYSVDRDLGRTAYDEVAAALVDMGWTSSDPIAQFAPYPQHVPLAWHLPGHPRLLLARAGTEECPRTFAVVERPDGHAWLAENAGSVLRQRTFRYYGNGIEARQREPDVVVAELRPSAGLLESTLDSGALVYRSNRQRLPACLAAWTGPGS